ncbi:hypothetical protein N7X58_09900 [Leuconostoc mesenteroides]|uniref:DUF6681 family protein n=1 Tax=Leuconostoc mesenteroides TaxID=1245 RepID=UPI0021CE2397|nr:DUF6681 family protein [Leuconostoc mesenteroides]MCU4665789.1 hypothetical protein [Leuconostoc mesenteroides]
MLTVLDLINHYLGYFTTNSKTKGRIYTVVGAGGVWYLLYLAYRFFVNGRWLRGALIAAVFLLLLYFVILNIIYYFTKHTSKWDVSPRIEKLLGGPHEEKSERESETVIMPANGLYSRQNVMSGTVVSDAQQQANLDTLALEIRQLDLIANDYGHLGEQAQRQIIAQQGVIYANHPGTLLPYFAMRENNGTLQIFGGINQLQARELGNVSMVGLTPTAQALTNYRLAIASVVLIGGPSHLATRSELVDDVQPYKIKIEIAYDHI